MLIPRAGALVSPVGFRLLGESRGMRDMMSERICCGGLLLHNQVPATDRSKQQSHKTITGDLQHTILADHREPEHCRREAVEATKVAIEALGWVLIVATIAVAAGELRLLHQIRKLPNKLYGVCLRIACVLALATFAINIAICFARDYGQLYAISLITSLPQAQSFLLAQLEMLRMLLPAYGVASPHIVTALQIGTSAVTTLALAAVIVSVFWTEWGPTIWIGTDMWIVTIGIYDVLQQLLMLHYVLVHLKNAPVWLRPWFGGLLAVNFLIIGAGPSVDLLLRDTHIAWNGIAHLLACTFILVGAEATQLVRSAVEAVRQCLIKPDVSAGTVNTIVRPTAQHKDAMPMQDSTVVAGRD